MENLFKKRRDRESPGIFVGRIIFGIIAVLALAILFGYAIMWLWNNLMPEIFGLSVINYWQAVGLFILSKILFSSGGCGGKHKSEKHLDKRRKHKFKSYYEKNCKGKLSEWEYYDRFWEEEGSEAYQKYVDKLNKETEQE